MTKKLTLFAIVMAAFILFVGCKKENELSTNYAFKENDFGNYSKNIVVTDAKGENSAVLLVGSNDKSYLDLWTENNFELIPVKTGESTKDVLDSFFAGRKQSSSMCEENADDIDTGKELYTMFLSKSLKDGVEKVLLFEKAPETAEKGWKYATHYSYALDAGGTITCYVYGANFWHWGYYGLSWRGSASQSWSTIVSEWKQVGRNDSFTHTKTRCYQMRARRKYTGSPESVTIQFDF